MASEAVREEALRPLLHKLRARDVVGSQGDYIDGIWTYSWPWAIYLLKTGDVDFVKANFSGEGPNGLSTPSIASTSGTRMGGPTPHGSTSGHATTTSRLAPRRAACSSAMTSADREPGEPSTPTTTRVF